MPKYFNFLIDALPGGNEFRVLGFERDYPWVTYTSRRFPCPENDEAEEQLIKDILIGLQDTPIDCDGGVLNHKIQKITEGKNNG